MNHWRTPLHRGTTTNGRNLRRRLRRLPALLAVIALILGGLATVEVVSAPPAHACAILPGSCGSSSTAILGPVSGTYGDLQSIKAVVTDESTGCAVNAIACNNPSGTVSFFDTVGGTLLGTVPLVPYCEPLPGGTACANTFDQSVTPPILFAGLPAGDLTLFAQYNPGGSLEFDASSGTLGITIAQALTSTYLSQSSSSSVVGDTVTFTATVIPDRTPNLGAGVHKPGGDVEFLVDGASAASAPMDASGEATLPWSVLDPGLHLISARYMGDGDYATSESTNEIHHVASGPPADLVLTLDDLAPALLQVPHAGGSAVARAALRFRNAGPGTSPGVKVSFSTAAPSELTFVSSDYPGLACSGSVCSSAVDLPPGPAEYTLVVDHTTTSDIFHARHAAVGIASLDATVTDPDLANNTRSAAVEINRAPATVDDDFGATSMMSPGEATHDVLANDPADPEGDVVTVTSIETSAPGCALPDGLDAEVASPGSIRVQATTFVGDATICYLVTDALGGQAEGLLHITASASKAPATPTTEPPTTEPPAAAPVGDPGALGSGGGADRPAIAAVTGAGALGRRALPATGGDLIGEAVLGWALILGGLALYRPSRRRGPRGPLRRHPAGVPAARAAAPIDR